MNPVTTATKTARKTITAFPDDAVVDSSVDNDVPSKKVIKLYREL